MAGDRRVFAARSAVPDADVFDATVPIYDKAMRSGHAEQDTAAVCAVLGDDGRRQNGGKCQGARRQADLIGPRAAVTRAKKSRHRGLGQHGFGNAVGAASAPARRRSAVACR